MRVAFTVGKDFIVQILYLTLFIVNLFLSSFDILVFLGFPGVFARFVLNSRLLKFVKPLVQAGELLLLGDEFLLLAIHCLLNLGHLLQVALYNLVVPLNVLLVGLLSHQNRVVGSGGRGIGVYGPLGGHGGGILALCGKSFALFLGQFFPLYLSTHQLAHGSGEVVERFLGNDAVFILVFVPFLSCRPLQCSLEEDTRLLHTRAIVDNGVVIGEFLLQLFGSELFLVVLSDV